VGTKSAVLKAIRAKCLDCSNQQNDEVRECVIKDCPLYHYRMGKNPFTNRKGNPNFKKAIIESTINQE